MYKVELRIHASIPNFLVLDKKDLEIFLNFFKIRKPLLLIRTFTLTTVSSPTIYDKGYENEKSYVLLNQKFILKRVLKFN